MRRIRVVRRIRGGGEANKGSKENKRGRSGDKGSKETKRGGEKKTEE